MSRSLSDVSGAFARRCANRLGRLVVVTSLLGASALAPGRAAHAEDGGSVPAAVEYLETLQFDSGGFDAPDGFAGFLTADVAFALAQAGQSDDSWSTAEALAAVQSMSKNGNDALDYLDDQADGVFGALSSGKAAQLVILVSALGLDPVAFDPQGDAATDLVAVMDAGAPSFGSIYTAPLGALADAALGREASSDVRDYIVSQQGEDGSFGDSPDTTGLAVAALVAAGDGFDDDAVHDALAYLARQQAPSGGFLSFGSTSVNSTAMAIVGIAAAGFDRDVSCWRDLAAPELAGNDYAAVSGYLGGVQAASGAIADPADFDAGFATAQAIQGLLHRFVPPIVADAPVCETGGTTTTTRAVTSTTDIDAQATTTTAAVSPTTNELPRTGSASGPVTAVALAFVTLGGVLLLGVGARRRAAH